MTQRRRRKSRKWLGRILFLILLIVAVVVVYLVWSNYFRNEDVKREDDAVEETTQVVEEDEPKQETVTVKKEEVKQYDGEDPNTANDLTGVVTYAGVVGSELVIRINIDQYLAGGSCSLTLTQGGVAVYDDVAEIIDSASTATCAGFNVPVASLNNGEISIEIKLEANGKKGVIIGGVEL